MIIWGIALLCLLWSLFHDLPINREIGENSSFGQPYVFMRDEDYCEDILVRSTEEYVYVFYYDINLVKVYDMDGNYLVSIGFHKAANRRQKAVRTMVTRGREMNLQFRNGDIYVFDGLTLSRYVSSNDPGSDALSNTLAKVKNESRFFVEWGNVYRREGNGDKTPFLQRNLWHRLMPGRIMLICMGAVIVLMAIVTGPAIPGHGNRRQRRNLEFRRK